MSCVGREEGVILIQLCLACKKDYQQPIFIMEDEYVQAQADKLRYM